MKILFCSSVYPQPGEPARGIYCRNLLEAVPKPHEVRVIAPWPWPARLRYLVEGKGEGPGSRGARLPVAYPTFYYPPGLLKNSRGWFMQASARSAFRELLDGGFRPDCMLSYWTHPDGEAALRMARSIDVPVALIVGGSDVLLLAKQPPRRRRCFIEVLRSVQEVHTVSEDLRSKVIELGVDPGRVHVALQGVDPVLFSPGDRQDARRRLGLPGGIPVLLWVGRMVPVKALDVLLRACAELKALGVAFHLFLVGDGPLMKSLEVLATDLGLREDVTFAGPRPQPELPDWYRASDVVVLPSHSEGIPNVLREAQACGRPFVATRVGGIPEVADPATSRLVAPGSADELAEAIRATLAEPPDPAAVAARAKSSSWEESAQRLLERLRAMIKSATPGPLSVRVPGPENGRELGKKHV